MRRLLISVFAANVALSLVALAACPDPMATHFGTDGRPDGWMSRLANSLIMLGVDALILALFLTAPRLVLALPPGLINLPDKDYWLRPENRESLAAVFGRRMQLFGAATLGFMFVVELLVVAANLSDPVRLPSGPFWLAFGLYMLYTAYWCVTLIAALRAPRPRNRA